jgi:hypothetical protein
MLSRRDFLRGAAVGAGGLVLGGSAVTLGRRLLTVSRGGGELVNPAYDEEFSGDMGAWVAPDFGFGQADINDTVPGKAFMPIGTALARGSVPPTPFTVTAFCSRLDYANINTTFGNASLFVGEASPLDSPGPDLYALQYDVAFLGEIGIIDGFWPGYQGDNDHLGPYVELGGIEWELPHYQRLVVHSGMNIDSYYSWNGTDWTTYDTGTNPGLSNVGSVGLLSYQCETEWDWIRFT